MFGSTSYLHKTVNEMNDLGQSDEQISINVMTVVIIYNWI